MRSLPPVAGEAGARLHLRDSRPDSGRNQRPVNRLEGGGGGVVEEETTVAYNCNALRMHSVTRHTVQVTLLATSAGPCSSLDSTAAQPPCNGVGHNTRCDACTLRLSTCTRRGWLLLLVDSTHSSDAALDAASLDTARTTLRCVQRHYRQQPPPQLPAVMASTTGTASHATICS